MVSFSDPGLELAADLADAAVVVEIFLVITRQSVSLSRIDIIFAGFLDNALGWFVPVRVGVETRANIAAGRGLFFFKSAVAAKPGLTHLTPPFPNLCELHGRTNTYPSPSDVNRHRVRTELCIGC
jgi:hypothetical protein